MTETPVISVLMPVYNAERFLTQALESIVGQSFGDFELLVVNDGSTDRSLEIIRSFESRDGRIRVIDRANRGLVASLNEMLDLARGELIARMDADDIALPVRFEAQVAYLRKHPEVVCVGGGFELIDEQGRLLTRLNVPETDHDIQQTLLAGNTAICHPTAMMRRNGLARVGGYDESMVTAEDLDLWLRLGEVGQLANLASVILRYRLNTGSVSGQNRNNQRLQAQRACEAAWKRRGIAGTFEATDHWRPGADAASRHPFMLQYGWWAFQSGERVTAIIYALKAIRLRPFAIDGWRLLVCALVKPVSPRIRDNHDHGQP